MEHTTATLLLFGLMSLLAGGSCASLDLRNETIACIFREYGSCYKDIASLGANFSVFYDSTPLQINQTCRSENNVMSCISAIPSSCNYVKRDGITNQISFQIHRLCTNRSTDQISFLNSSYCYNKFQARRDRCVKTNSPGAKTDAKSLCCSNKKTLECLFSGMASVCPQNTTNFQNTLMNVYRGHHFAVCGPYLKYCSEASTTLVSAVAVMASSLLSLVLQKI